MHFYACKVTGFSFFFQEVEQNFEKEGTKEIERIRGVYFQALKSIEK